MPRCGWATNDRSIRYHDEEWGVPVHGDRVWFEFLVLEGAQAGLSWDTILKRREGYRSAFEGFDPGVVARYGQERIEALLADPRIIRNRLKVASAVKNAGALLEIRREFGSFDAYMWPFVGGRPILNAWRTREEVPARTDESDALSKDLKARGFTFVGSTICYALMQATGPVNDHLVGCFRHAQVSRPGRATAGASGRKGDDERGAGNAPEHASAQRQGPGSGVSCRIRPGNRTGPGP